MAMYPLKKRRSNMMRPGVFFQGKYVSLVKDDENAPKNCDFGWWSLFRMVNILFIHPESMTACAFYSQWVAETLPAKYGRFYS